MEVFRPMKKDALAFLSLSSICISRNLIVIINLNTSRGQIPQYNKVFDH